MTCELAAGSVRRCSDTVLAVADTIAASEQTRGLQNRREAECAMAPAETASECRLTTRLSAVRNFK